jgi:hypothetical protein
MAPGDRLKIANYFKRLPGTARCSRQINQRYAASIADNRVERDAALCWSRILQFRSQIENSIA